MEYDGSAIAAVMFSHRGLTPDMKDNFIFGTIDIAMHLTNLTYHHTS
jgi:hypothetical protein